MMPVAVATESMHRYHEQLIGKLEERNKELLKTKLELEKTIQLLTESQHIAHMGSWDLNLQTFECVWSDEIYHITGAIRTKIKASPEAFLSFIHPDDYERVKQIIDSSIATARPTSFNCRLLRPDGQVRHIYTYAAYTYNSEGIATRAYGITHDVTERKLAEEEVINLNAELEARVEQRTAELLDANQQLESFAYSVSHDLRSPLRSIHSFAQLVNKKYSPQLEQDGKELIQFICESSSKMGLLIEDLLSFSGLGKKKIERMEIDMNKLVEKTWTNITERMEHIPDISIKPLPHIVADKPMITQVLVNYLSNAIKYSGKTSAPVIEVGAEESPDEMMFFVKDNGAGFDMAHYDKLFNVFQRLHSTNEFEGTGVGLAIVKRIIDKHNGRVWAESIPGQGAKFYFALPNCN
jgi:PAS domain S-box-containing protein